MDRGRGEERCDALAELQYGAFTREQALTVGVPARTVERRAAAGRWREVYPRVYRHAGTPETWRLRTMAAVLWGGPGTVASHRAAAALWELDGYRESLVEITTPQDRKSRVDLLVHRLRVVPAQDCQRRDGIMVTRPLRTLFDLAAVLKEDDQLEKAIDEALRRGWVREPLLRWAAERMGGRGRPGSVRFCRVLRRRQGTLARTGSSEETRFLVLFAQLGLPPPRTQYRIRLQDGSERVADFAWVEAGVWVEIDGYRYHSSRRAWARDQTRSNALVALGWRLFRFTREDRSAPGRLRALLGPLVSGPGAREAARTGT